ncbi:arylsulfatase [Aquisediminimonas sediminicola]|uniref:arylsulfatase n=1 Tax=Alteraquisediminimonas sediminicola TaxID=2676787 RepID=UPI001C8D6D3F|nr:arylsulfatase [Aquisediminimonas sediminicola]
MSVSTVLVFVLHGIGIAQGVDRTVLPVVPAPFIGRIGLTAANSTPDWPKPVKAPSGAPNVLVIMTDDIGFGTSSTFGGAVPTPTLEALARDGARYNKFHTTAMCSPTRAALLTGRNAHAVGSGAITDVASGYPGYTSVIPRSSATIARILRDNGYSTAMFGKHHNIPRWEASLSGPFDRWPTGLGFEYFFGFIIGDTDQWHPRLYRNTLAVDDKPQDGATLDNLLANDAIHWLHQQKAASPDKPFFLYYATGTGHGPHQAPAQWISRFRGKFDQGWDEVREETFARQKQLGIIPSDAILTQRPKEIPAWSSLTPAQQRVYSRYMEVFAGMVAYQDEQIGRLIAELRRMGQLDNTMIFFIEGDNGASAEGGLNGTFNEIGHHKNGLAVRRTLENDLNYLADMGGPGTQPLYPAGWAWGMGAPFQWTKQVASHLGGIRNGLVVRWPGHVFPSEITRNQFAHVTDIMPTILEATGIPEPRLVDGVLQQEITGRSLAYTFANPKAAEPARTQYFEMLGNRGVYRNGWFAGTSPKRVPWKVEATPGDAWSSYQWELYNLDEDYSQSEDLAARLPGRLKEMQGVFFDEARRNNVLPIDDELSPNRLSAARRHYEEYRSLYEWWGSDISIAEDVGPSFTAASFSVTIDLKGVAPNSTGVMFARGSWFGGWSFYLDNGRPTVMVAASERSDDQFRVSSHSAVSTDSAHVVFRFTSHKGGKSAGGEMCIEFNGKADACGQVARTPAVDAGQGETIDVGKDSGVPVTFAYPVGAKFPGKILKVAVETH